VKSDVDLSQLAIDRTGNADANATRRPRRHLLARYVLPSAVLLGAAGLMAWAGQDVLFPPQPVTVIPVVTTQSEVQNEGTPLFKAAGWIEPRPTPVRVAALAPGVVDKLLVVEDQPVKAGETIAELVREDAQLVFEQAEADLSLREAELQAAQATLTAAETRYNQPVHLEAALAEADAELATVQTQLVNLPFEQQRAEADLAYARSNFEGKTSAGEAVTQRVVDEARRQLQSAQALADELHGRTESLSKQKDALARRRDALKKTLELRTEELQARDEAKAEVAAAQARIHQAQVAMAEAKLQLDRMTVRSTVDGRVLHLVARPGSRLVTGRGNDEAHDGSTVVTLYQPNMLQVRVDVRFEDLPRIQLGQPVTIGTPALSSPLEGQVLSLGSEADTQKNTLEVKVAITDPSPVLKPEMLVEVTFLAMASPERSAEPSDRLRLLIPQQLVQREADKSFVWIADQSAGIAVRTTIELGSVANDGLVEVTEGLNAASRLIATGHENLRNRQRIQVTGENSLTPTRHASEHKQLPTSH
jgi:RND family efflux transporter MFP subunit